MNEMIEKLQQATRDELIKWALIDSYYRHDFNIFLAISVKKDSITIAASKRQSAQFTVNVDELLQEIEKSTNGRTAIDEVIASLDKLLLF